MKNFLTFLLIFSGCLFVIEITASGDLSDMSSVCDPLSVVAAAGGVVCPGDPFTLNATLNEVIPGEFMYYTVNAGVAGSCTALPDNPADCVDLALGDNAGSGLIPLGFNFDFFGNTYTDVCVSSNGYVTFTCTDETDSSEDPIPTPGDPDGFIALFWDDLDPAGGGTICTYPATLLGQTCFVVEYDQVVYCCSTPNETVSGQIIICPDNSITINCIDCQSDDGTDTAVQGIEDETGTTGYFAPAFQGGTVPAATSTSNCVTFIPNANTPSACEFVAWVTDINDIAGTTVSTTLTATVYPTINTTYYAVVDCGGELCFDEVVVTTNCLYDCPTSNPLQLDPDLACEGQTLDFLLGIQVDDPDGTQLGDVVWFVTYDFDNADPTTDPVVDVTAPVVYTGTDPCYGGDPLTVYTAFVQCDANLDGIFDLNDGDQWTPLTTWAFWVLPPKQAPTIILDDDACNYTIIPVCPNDMLDITTVTAAPGEDPAPIDVVVTYPNFGFCASTFQVDPPACPDPNTIICPISNFIPPFDSEFICDGATFTQIPMAGNQFNITNPDNTQLGGIMWFTGSDPAIDLLVDVTAPVLHSGVDLCVKDPAVTYYAFIQCDADLNGFFDLNNGDQWIQVASHTFEVYPAPQNPTIFRSDSTCNYIMFSACTNEVLDVITITAAPGEDPAPVNFDLTTANGCTGTVSVDPQLCPAPTMLACPTSETFLFQPEYICEENVLTFAGNSYTITDTDGTQLGGVIWFAGPDPTVDPIVDVTAPVVHPGPELCDIVDVFIYAFVQCDADLNGVFDLNNGDQWVEVNSHWYILLPAKQTPIITLDDDVCNYTITPNCPGDVLSITTLTVAPGEDPEPIDVVVGMSCTTTFQVDPPPCLPTGVCEDAIMGTVTTDEPTCDLAGTMIEILDSNGIPVAGSPVTIDAMGNYSLPGPFVCGTYTAEIVAGSAPQCYYDLSGTEGPFEFEVDGDGTADGVNFSTQPQVPTLSQWGLIILALLMMCFGAIKMAYNREKVLSNTKLK